MSEFQVYCIASETPVPPAAMADSDFDRCCTLPRPALISYLTMAAAPPAKAFSAKNIFEWIPADSVVLKALAGIDKNVLLERVRSSFAIPESTSDITLFRQLMSFFKLPGCPESAVAFSNGFKITKKRLHKRKRNFIYACGLHVSSPEREAFLLDENKVPTYTLSPLKKPYPPFKKIVSETPEIHAKWFHHFKFGKQADARKERRQICHLVPKNLKLDIRPTENARILAPDGTLVGLVIRNFFPNDEAVAWADEAVEEQVVNRRNIRVSTSDNSF